MSSSCPSVLLRRTPPREVLDAGRSLLSVGGCGCGRTRGGRGLRDRVDSTLGPLDLVTGTSLSPRSLPRSGSWRPFRGILLLALAGEGGCAIGNGAIAASSALGCGSRGRGVVDSSGVATPGLFPGGGGGLGGGLGASFPSCPGCPGFLSSGGRLGNWPPRLGTLGSWRLIVIRSSSLAVTNCTKEQLRQWSELGLSLMMPGRDKRQDARHS